jgi:hypothetical protein
MYKNRNLKKELLSLFNDMLCKELTQNNVEILYDQLFELFNYFDLNDFRFNLIKDTQNQKIIFNPIRTIDKYCLDGILSLVD